MRVIAGKYRGRKLNEFDINSTKPTLDRVKEAIFSSIQFDIINACVLDLFSGTGGMGIEAISRGAKKTYFVDIEDKAIKLIKSNLKNINENYEICKKDYANFLKENTDKKFDIVFIDPPFNTDYAEQAIDFLIDNDMLGDKGIIVYEKSKDKKYDKDYSNFKKSVKTYGSVEVIIFRKLQTQE